MEVNYSITDSITSEEYMKLREAVGWGLFPLEEAQAGLRNSYIWCLRDNEASGKPIGIGRVIWDHGYVMYIADIIVIPEYQGNGIGTAIVNRLLDYITEHTEEGNFTSVGLTAAEGKEGFYKRFGFSKSRGMTKYIER